MYNNFSIFEEKKMVLCKTLLENAVIALVYQKELEVT